MNRRYLVFGVSIVLVAAASFFAGQHFLAYTTRLSAANTFNSGPGGGTMGNRSGYGGGFGGRFRGGHSTFGTVQSVSGSTLVLKDRSGNIVDIALSSDTVITDQSGSNVSASSIQTGDTVVVMGSTSNGTLTAARVRIMSDSSGGVTPNSSGSL